MDKFEKIRLILEARDSKLHPEVVTMFEIMPFKNAERTSDDKAATGGSWKKYWKVFTQQDFPTTCPFCGEPLEEDDIDGCHINVGRSILGSKVTYGQKKFIIPGHHACNMQLGAEFKCKIDVKAIEAIEKD